MIRNVYLFEYEFMTFKERLYIVRNNQYKSWLSGYYIANPFDWSLRMLWAAWIKLVVAIVWPIVYWPVMIITARDLKTLHANDKDKYWFHSGVKVIK